MEINTVKVNGREIKVLEKKQAKSFLGGYIILVHGWNDVTPYVVWRYYPEDGSCHSGDYCRTLREALGAFDNRD